MAPYHPHIVHFVIALLIVGVSLRLISLFGRPAFAGPAAATLLVLGTIAAALAVRSGTDAHEPVEDVPGSREAVAEHEEWGERTRNIFFGVIAIEAAAFLMRRSPRRKYLHVLSGAVGLVGLFSVYEAAEHGGRLVYSYAGGVGIRTGDRADVQRLLLAGLYHEGQLERTAGRSAEAARLFALAGERFPNDVEVQLLAAESLLVDRKDPVAALARLRSLMPPRENRALRIRHGLLAADALEMAGERDGAVAVVQALVAEFPDAPRLTQRLDALKPAALPK